MSKKEDKDGVWRTVGGRRIFIADGEDLQTAMKKSGKFSKIRVENKNKNSDKEREEERTKKIKEDVKKHNIPKSIEDNLLSKNLPNRVQGVVDLVDFVAIEEEWEVETKLFNSTNFGVYDVDDNKINITILDNTYDSINKKIEEHFNKKGSR